MPAQSRNSLSLIHQSLSANGPATAQQVSTKLGGSLRATRNRLIILLRCGRVAKCGQTSDGQNIYETIATKETP